MDAPTTRKRKAETKAGAVQLQPDYFHRRPSLGKYPRVRTERHSWLFAARTVAKFVHTASFCVIVQRRQVLSWQSHGFRSSGCPVTLSPGPKSTHTRVRRINRRPSTPIHSVVRIPGHKFQYTVPPPVGYRTSTRIPSLSRQMRRDHHHQSSATSHLRWLR